MTYRTFSLHQLGWQPEYAQDLTVEDFETGYPARVMAAWPGELAVFSSRGQGVVARPSHVGDVAVGDWVLMEGNEERVSFVLARRSLMAVAMHGDGMHQRMLVANLDTLLIVSPCGGHIDTSLLRRYVTLALESGVTPVMVLTNIDASRHAEDHVAAARSLFPPWSIVVVDASPVGQLAPWLVPGRTVGLIRLPGASTTALLASLTGGAVDPMDAVGEMFQTSSGAWVLELPAMREEGLAAPVLA